MLKANKFWAATPGLPRKRDSWVQY